MRKKHFILTLKNHPGIVVMQIILFVCICIATQQLIPAAEQPPEYPFVLINPAKQIYDGDTIKDVAIQLKPLKNYPAETLFPGIRIDNETLYFDTDIRLRGIDTPEKRPVKKNRTETSLREEKAAAARARAGLYARLADANFKGVLKNPQLGKYAGRIVADIYIGDENISDYLLDIGVAVPYHGGTKLKWDAMKEKLK